MCFCSSRESKLNGTRWCVRKTPHFPGVPGFPLTKHEMGKERGEQKTLQGRPTGISHVAPSRCRWCDIPLCPQRSPSHSGWGVCRAVCCARILPGNPGGPPGTQ